MTNVNLISFIKIATEIEENSPSQHGPLVGRPNVRQPLYRMRVVKSKKGKGGYSRKNLKIS